MTEIDVNLQPVKSYIFLSDNSNFFADGRMSAYEDGTALFTRVRDYDLYNSDILIGKFNNGQIKRERIIPNRSFRRGSQTNFLPSPNGGDLTSQQCFDATTWVGIELLKIHDADTIGLCLGSDTSLTRVEEQNLALMPLDIDSILQISLSRLFDHLQEL
jgi:hypothetical protein